MIARFRVFIAAHQIPRFNDAYRARADLLRCVFWDLTKGQGRPRSFEAIPIVRKQVACSYDTDLMPTSFAKLLPPLSEVEAFG